MTPIVVMAVIGIVGGLLLGVFSAAIWAAMDLDR